MTSCDFCDRPYSGSAHMCPRCAKSYDAYRRKDDGSIHAIPVWAAKRARYFERLKHRKNKDKHHVTHRKRFR